MINNKNKQIYDFWMKQRALHTVVDFFKSKRASRNIATII